MNAAAIVILCIVLVLFVYLYLAVKKPAIALISCPFTGLIEIAISIYMENSIAWLLSVLLIPATCIAILIPRRAADENKWYRSAAVWLLIFLVLCFLAGIISALSSFLGVLSFAFIFFFVWLSITYASTSRFATAAYVLSTIGYCLRQNLPLPMALDSAAHGQSGNRISILLCIKKWLIQGYPLSQAIKLGYPGCPSDALAAITAAEKIDQLPHMFSSVEADMIAKADDRRRIRPVHPYYPFFLLIFASFIILAITNTVIPHYNVVIREMSPSGLPLATEILIYVTDWMFYQYGWILGLIFLVLSPFLVPYLVIARFRVRRPEKPYLISRIGDFIKWHLPIVHWFESNRSLTQAVESFRLSLNAGCTVDEAIRNTLSLDVNLCFKKKLQKWLKMVETGHNIAESARKCGIANSVAWAFDTTAGDSTLSVLDTLETFYRSNYSYKVNLARFILWPFVTIMLGLMIGFVVYAIFVPMVQVISIYSGSMVP